MRRAKQWQRSSKIIAQVVSAFDELVLNDHVCVARYSGTGGISTHSESCTLCRIRRTEVEFLIFFYGRFY